MGILSKKVTVVNSVSAKLIADTPNILKNSNISALIQNRDIVDELQNTVINEAGIKARHAYRYAEANYTNGLPQGFTEFYTPDLVALQAVLDSVEGEPVTLITTIVDDPNPDQLAQEFLELNRGYSTLTGIISNPPFTPLPSASTPVTLAGTTFSLTTPGYVTVEYTYTTSEETEAGTVVTIRTETEDIPVPLAYAPGVRHYYVQYSVNSTGLKKYWYYDESTGTYPTLALPPATSLGSPYYPIIPIRVNNVDYTRPEVQGTPLYQTSERLCQILGIDLALLGEGVHANPDINDIDHAHLYFATDLQTTAPAGIEYLYRYFENLYDNGFRGKREFDFWDTHGVRTAPPVQAVRIQDTEHNIQINFNWMTKTLVSGSIGPKDTYTRENNIQPQGVKLVSDYGAGEPQDAYIYYEQSEVIFRHQVTDTQYVELRINGLKHVNYVYGRHAVETTVALSTEEDNENFLIPLNFNVVSEMDLVSETELIYESLRLIFQSYEVVKLKWYQTTFFQFVVIVVSVILIPPSGGLSASWGGQLAAAAGITGSAATVAAVIFNIAIGIAISEGFTFLIRELGLGNTVLATIATISLMIATGTGGFNTEMLFSAEMFLFSVTLINQITTAYVNVEMEDLTRESKQFWEEAEEQLSVLEQMQKDLEPQDLIDPFTFIQQEPYFFPHETPTQFYDRSIHAGNVGLLAIESLHNYVDTQLTLPDIRTTLSTTGAA